jgi:hypothetical protein
MLHKDPNKLSAAKKTAGFGILAAVFAGVVLFSAFRHPHNYSTVNGTRPSHGG